VQKGISVCIRHPALIIMDQGKETCDRYDNIQRSFYISLMCVVLYHNCTSVHNNVSHHRHNHVSSMGAQPLS
jgi:hypothetical protein